MPRNRASTMRKTDFRSVAIAGVFGAGAWLWPLPARPAQADWLINPAPYVAKVAPDSAGRQIEMSNGLVRRVIQLRPGAGTVAFDDLMTSASLLRSARPEAVLELNGKSWNVGGLTGQPVHNYLDPQWLEKMEPDPRAFHFAGFHLGGTEPRFAWRKNRAWLSQDYPWPPPGAGLTLRFEPPADGPAVTVEVHYEIYDGLPLISKWLSLTNESAGPVTLDGLVVERLAVVEPESIVDGSATNFRGAYRQLEAFS